MAQNEKTVEQQIYEADFTNECKKLGEFGEKFAHHFNKLDDFHQQVIALLLGAKLFFNLDPLALTALSIALPRLHEADAQSTEILVQIILHGIRHISESEKDNSNDNK
jgi:hypothetical protein